MPRVKQGPRNSVNDRPSPWRLLLRRQRRLVRPAAWVGLASVVGAVLVISVHAVSSHAGGTMVAVRERLGAATAAFGLRVHDVVIEGRANTPEPLLNAAIGVRKGSPILGFSLEETRARIESIPWVERATVERRLPGTVVINLQERRPFAIWQNQGKFVLVDREGQVVTNQDAAQFRHLPLIVGTGAPTAAAELLDALRDRPALAEKVAASVRVGQRRWNLHMNNGMDVMLPEGHEVAALDRLMQLQQQHDLLDRPLAAIDLRLPDRLVFRPRPEQAKDGTPLPPVPPAAPPPTVPVIAKKPT
ncbi:MAG TPA: cell division protein FtsQ/DivIB [Rhodopila sp.]|nr:cell division protein FtsQ/DivIB [Rhodopila sp.]